jgi:hypothetical protein
VILEDIIKVVHDLFIEKQHNFFVMKKGLEEVVVEKE